MFEWKSPYQNEAYFQACSLAGMDCSKLELNGRTYYFYKSGSSYVAWELPQLAVQIIDSFPSGYQGYLHTQVGTYDSMDWSNSFPSYSTLFSLPNDVTQKDSDGLPVTYSKRFKRSLAKGITSGLVHGLAETDEQVNSAIQMFQEHEDRRDGLEVGFFHNSVWQWLLMNAADLHVIQHMNHKALLGAAVVLKSNSQSNLRYYTSERSSINPGHFLHHNLLSYYLEKRGFKVVDQSGITSPLEPDLKLRGISEFKLQTSERVSRFILR